MRDLPADERGQVLVNSLTVLEMNYQSAIETRRDELKKDMLNKQLEHEKIDVTLPGKPVARGSLTSFNNY